MLDIETEHRLAWYHSHYNPDQPRVPAGHSDGGQWTRADGIRLATSEKPGLSALLAAALHLALLTIEAYRSKNNLLDLFGNKRGTVTWTRINGKDIFGSNSRSPTYTSADLRTAEMTRAVLIQKYPNLMKSDKIGQKPNDAVFHAETTILLRAARENGGTLAGKELEVFSDRPLCDSCQKVLPFVGLELGNPTVSFTDNAGRRLTMRNGEWKE